VSRARQSMDESEEEAKCEKGFSSRPHAGFIGSGNRWVVANWQQL
jgi:hypothetical protein